MDEWIQFSVWDKRWPHRAITDFIPAFRVILGPGIRWHFLYEPCLLIRVNLPYDGRDTLLYRKAEALAQTLGYRIQRGDASKTSQPGKEFWYSWDVEVGYYGSRELSEVNANMLWATSELMVALQREGKLNFPLLRKHSHLFCNAAGKDYLRSAWFQLRCAVRDLRLFLRYGYDF